MSPLVDMLRAGAGTLRRYTGMVLALYLVQLVLALGAGWVMLRILASALAHQPVFDAAVAGDLPALMTIVREHGDLFRAMLWIGIGTALAYAAISLLLIGGLNAVLLHAPRGRAGVAARFGAGAVLSAWGYVRVSLWSLLAHALIAVVAAIGGALMLAGQKDAVTAAPVLGRLALGLTPAALLLLSWRCVTHYARIEISAQPRLAAWRALRAGLRTSLSSAWPLVHLLSFYLVFLSLTVVFGAITTGRSLPGLHGALALFGVRQTVAIARFCARIVLAGGQVRYARLRGLVPPEE